MSISVLGIDIGIGPLTTTPIKIAMGERRISPLANTLRPGWGWCQDKCQQEENPSCWGSTSVAIPICAHR